MIVAAPLRKPHHGAVNALQRHPMSKTDLCPIFALITDYNFQIKIQESPGARYEEGKTTSYFKISIEDVGENRDNKDRSPPKELGAIYLSQEELMALSAGLDMIAREKGY